MVYQVAALTVNGEIDFLDINKWNTIEEAEVKLMSLKSKYNGSLRVIRRLK